MDLVDWLRHQLTEKQLSQSELARRSNISHATISRVLSKKQPQTYDLCIAIADGLGEPRAVVLDLAGLLPDLPDYKLTPEIIEWLQLFEQMSEEDREELWKIGRIKAGKRREKRKAKT
jgi:transcriptional regulator with XRE-family HTH domain